MITKAIQAIQPSLFDVEEYESDQNEMIPLVKLGLRYMGEKEHYWVSKNNIPLLFDMNIINRFWESNYGRKYQLEKEWISYKQVLCLFIICKAASDKKINWEKVKAGKLITFIQKQRTLSLCYLICNYAENKVYASDSRPGAVQCLNDLKKKYKPQYFTWIALGKYSNKCWQLLIKHRMLVKKVE